MYIVEEATDELLKRYNGGKFIGGPLYNGADTIVNGTLKHAHVSGRSVVARVELKWWAFGTPDKADRLLWRTARGLATIMLPINLTRKKNGDLEFHEEPQTIHSIIKPRA